ncbi:class C beta-lactamase-related serine hydrolase [Rhodobacteraceae bacterium W635]|uniref:serine hydrolase domain-containing protein n=1 Tax=Nioella halotolerans TaxID=2303578 RepID=UPI000E3BF6E1|nr:class C beta-lactamase-related serine hydrolase [Rhodobacteraceae bacterium W635]
MRRVMKVLGRVLVVFIAVALALGLYMREEIVRLLAVNTLFEAESIVENFSNMDRAFLTAPVPRGTGPASPLPEGDAADLPPQVAGWIEDRAVTSLLVLHDGRIVHESYHLGTAQGDRRISWSVAKSFLSALLGTLVADGTIPDLDAPVTEHAPMLVGSAYDGATIRNVLQMASGVRFDEDYLDYDSDINRMGREIALGGTLDGFAAGLTDTDRPPGQAWRYVSMDTHVIGMVIRGATGRDIPSLMSERIIGPLGLDATPYYLTDGEGVAFVLGGLNITTRDYARMGMMMLRNGAWNGRQIVPADWVAQSTVASAPTAPGALGYGYQWWIPEGGEPGQVMARGIYGQYVYVDRVNDVVIATTGADRRFREDGVHEENMRVFRAIAESL